MKTSKLLSYAPLTTGVAFAIALQLDAHAATVPTFTSGPAIVSRADANELPNSLSTFVFGYQSGAVAIIGYRGSTAWTFWDGHHLAITGGYNGDPAAAYTFNNKIMNCGHAVISPGYMYCARGVPPALPTDHYVTEEDPYPVGAGTFNPGSSPVLVNVNAGNRFINMFARGQNNQIWYAVYSDWAVGAGKTWNGWSQIPSPSGDSFVSDPGATVYASVAGNDKVVVCARLTSNQQIACTFYNGAWSVWNPVAPASGQPGAFKPALTRGPTSVFLFGIRNNVNPNFDVVFNAFPFGGGPWGGGWSQLSGGDGFLSGPAAFASQTYKYWTMTVGRGGDSAFWFDVGHPNVFNTGQIWTGWAQLQVN